MTKYFYCKFRYKVVLIISVFTSPMSQLLGCEKSFKKWSLHYGEMGPLTFYQLYLKSLHIIFCFKFGSQQLVLFHGFHLRVRKIKLPVFQHSLLLFQAAMFVLQACDIAPTLNFPSVPSKIWFTAPSCPFWVDTTPFFFISLLLSTVYHHETP